MRLVAGARQDLRAQRGALALEGRADGAGDRGVDRARERQPLGRRPVRVRRRGGRAQRPFVVGLRQQIVELTEHAPDLVGGRDLSRRQPAPQVGGLLIDEGAHLFPPRATSFQPSATVRTGCSSGRRRKATCVPSRASTVQSSSAQLPNARPASISPSSSDRVTRSPGGQRRRAGRPPPARAARPAPPSRDRAPAGVGSGSRSSNRRSPISVASSGCACRCASQYAVASAASACGGIHRPRRIDRRDGRRRLAAARPAAGPARQRQRDQQKLGGRTRHGTPQ